jgi:hypothetical protein
MIYFADYFMKEPPRHQDAKLNPFIRRLRRLTQIMNFFAARLSAAEGGKKRIHLR